MIAAPLRDQPEVLIIEEEHPLQLRLRRVLREPAVLRPRGRRVAGLVRVEVNDGGSDNAPGVQRADGESGRGLGLVAAIATCWGHTGGPSASTVIGTCLLYTIGSALLAADPALCEVRLSPPNKHHYLLDPSPFGLNNDREVYLADERPRAGPAWD
jgi:hypothetical protein